MFLIAGFVTSLLVIACFVSQTDVRVSRIPRWHATYLYTLIIASWCVPWLLLITFGERTENVIRYSIVLLQFVLLAVVYVKYRLAGVLALHMSGILMYLIFVAICMVDSVLLFGEMPSLSAEFTFALALAMLSGSLTSASYALIYIAIRRRARKPDRSVGSDKK